MKELEDLVKGWRALPAGTPAILATVVATEGSTYRKAGAKMLLTETGWIAGSVSGGCLESDLIQSAWKQTLHGPALLTYDATADEDILWGFGLGCNGVVRVFLERVEADGPLPYMADRFDRSEFGVVTTVIEPGSRFGEHAYLDGPPFRGAHTRRVEGSETFFDPIVPPQELVIFGAGHDAAPLVVLAKALGWHVAVADRRDLAVWAHRFAQADRTFVYTDGATTVRDGAALVLMTHNYRQDRDLLRFALASPAAYIGIMGPKLRTERLLRELRDDGFVPSAGQLKRLHGPVGLDLGAETPDEIALSILSEIQAFLHHRSASPLRESSKPLHSARTNECSLSA